MPQAALICYLFQSSVFPTTVPKTRQQLGRLHPLLGNDFRDGDEAATDVRQQLFLQSDAVFHCCQSSIVVPGFAVSFREEYQSGRKEVFENQWHT